MLKIYQYPKCSTCRKALKWLDEHQVEYRSIDISARPPSKAELKRVLTLTGLPIAKLFNTSGQSYRAGNFGKRLGAMTVSQALDALATDGKLIKRPLVLDADVALVGFKPEVYAQCLGG